MKTLELLEKLNALKPYVATDVYAKPMLEQLIAAVEDDFRSESAAQRGNNAAYNVITKMLKVNRDFRPGISYAHIDSENRQCCIDGYYGFRLRDHLPLEPRPADVGDPVDLDKIFPNADDFATKFLPIKLPSAADVKIAIAQQKANGKKKDFLYDFGPDRPCVNAQYLLNILTVIPDADVIWYSSIVSPMFVFTDRSEAVILPIRTGKRYSDDKTTAAQTLHRLLIDYREKVHADSEYAISIDRLADLVRLEAIAAV